MYSTSPVEWCFMAVYNTILNVLLPHMLNVYIIPYHVPFWTKSLKAVEPFVDYYMITLLSFHHRGASYEYLQFKYIP